MITKIILCVSILPVLLILYVMFAGMGKEQNNSLFGITLWQGAMKEERIQNLIKDYKKQVRRMMLILLLIQFLVYLPSYFSIMITLWMIWLFGMIIVMNIPYIQANKKMRMWKTQYQLSQGESPQNNTYADVSAATEEKPKYFWKSTLIAGIAGFLPAVAAVILDKNVSNPAAPDLWIIEIVLLSMALVGLICVWAVHHYNQQPVAVLTTESEVNIQFSRIRSYQWSKAFCILAWLTVVFSGVLLADFYLDSDNTIVVLMVSCILYGLMPFVFFGMSCYVIQKQKRRLLEGRELLLPEDDENWIWGMIYYNKNDSRFWVDKKVGIGFTSNMAKPGAIILDVAAILLVIVLCGGAGVWAMLEEFTPVKLAYENGQLTALHWKEEYEIEKEDIKSVTLLEELPNISRTNGTGMDIVYKGNFFSREYDRRFKVCLNPQEEPVLMIETADGTWYLLGDNQAEQTMKIYEKLISN